MVVVKITSLLMSVIAHYSIYISIAPPKAVMKLIVLVCILVEILTQKLIGNVQINCKVCYYLPMVHNALWNS